jgi:hypothetical protein
MSIKNSFVIALCTIGFAACSEPEKKDNGGGTPRPPAIGDACTSGQLGDTACASTTSVIYCDGGAWQLASTCSGGRVCGDTGGGVFNCVSDGGGTTIEVPSCTYASADVTPIFFDADTFGYHDIIGTIAADEVAGTPERQLEIQNWPGFGPGLTAAGSTPIDGENGDFATCGTCVLAAEQVDAETTRWFLASTGTANFTALPAAAGENLDLTLTTVHFREVELDFANFTHTDVPGGIEWDLDTFSISGPAQYYPCLFTGLDPDETVCMQTAGTVIGCGGDCVRLADTCGGNGCEQVSRPASQTDTTPYEAACQ